jgi:hypothetical protein
MADEQEYLLNQITRWQTIVDGLENNDAFRMMVEDFQERSIKQADENWHLLNIVDEKQKQLFFNLQYSKLAALGITNAIDAYKADIQKAQKRIAELTGAVQGSYVEE